MQNFRFERRARQFEWVTLGVMALLLLVTPIALADGALSLDRLRADYDTPFFPDAPSIWAIALWRGVEITSFALLLWVLWCLRLWLAACADGDTFHSDTARRVLRIGQGLLLLAVFEVLSHTAIILALTWNNPPGQRSLAITLDGTELFLLLSAGLLTLFGYIQSEAARLTAENREFV